MFSPKVSVIIPCYNVEKYLSECLDSVLGQTLREIEVICIEDCSTDRTYDILCDYKNKDSRITIIKNDKNRGLSYSRNRGIDVAGGKYVCFCDSDDTIELTALEKLYVFSEQRNLDVALFEFSWITNGATKVIRRPSGITGAVSGLDVMCIQANDFGLDTYCAVAFLLNINFIKENKLFFYEGIIHEDILYNFNVLTKAKRVSCLYEPLYNYRIRQSSITTKKVSLKTLQGIVVVFEEIIKFYFDAQIDRKYLPVVAQYLSNVFNHFCSKLELCDYSLIQYILKDENLDMSKAGLLLTYFAINQLKKTEMFAQKCNEYNEKIFSVQSAKEFDALLKSNRIVLWGTGCYGKLFLDYIHSRGGNVILFIDTDTHKEKEKMYGLNVKNVDKFASEFFSTTKSDKKEDFIVIKAFKSNNFNPKFKTFVLADALINFIKLYSTNLI